MDDRCEEVPMREAGATGTRPVEGLIEGLPGWYFVLVGLLVASNDLSLQFSDRYSWVALLPLVLVAVHLTLWFTLLARRRRYLRAVWRSKQALALVAVLFTLRLLLQFGLAKLTGEAAPLHSYTHLVIGLVMLVVTTAGAWFDQWLVLRVVNRDANRRR
ncbi:hypothetical protein AMES_2902 [Amycolatopsis mediterranei S699]|uniref:Transmembrane protein n=2 Tax=Amycolatopsis mediterranei TaxID=33910 RepID=A0A0H3D3H8_AMYMU|nr:hypothetical protein [Amycolatopsis mediterranei]ADJ44727.1 hypothetical protein AMED_2933 [Amycolatopsis mediterranei U32]AFO76438.1 hypothetical protein AMES_2902 [Amycolatopsis mediterranei S699]KDO07449.1 hypothetical protein DV26_29625 [Amycolatopsis mediterranei]KDU91784.1 hypothetical protein DV36_12425 [Amycolatopsis mediterranei]UZF69897.1 hypothetical protein ISP_003079 [Amycolatopsis mediterranei]